MLSLRPGWWAMLFGDRGQSMTMRNLALAIEKQLSGAGISYTSQFIDDSGGMWIITLRGEWTAVVSCETNVEDIKIPTVTFAIFVQPLESTPLESLLRFLELNSTVLGFYFSISPEFSQLGRMITFERRIAAASFQPQTIGRDLDEMLRQLSLCLT
jgi:hypothetical protein